VCCDSREKYETVEATNVKACIYYTTSKQLKADTFNFSSHNIILPFNILDKLKQSSGFLFPISSNIMFLDFRNQWILAEIASCRPIFRHKSLSLPITFELIIYACQS